MTGLGAVTAETCCSGADALEVGVPASEVGVHEGAVHFKSLKCLQTWPDLGQSALDDVVRCGRARLTILKVQSG